MLDAQLAGLDWQGNPLSLTEDEVRGALTLKARLGVYFSQDYYARGFDPGKVWTVEVGREDLETIGWVGGRVRKFDDCILVRSMLKPANAAILRGAALPEVPGVLDWLLCRMNSTPAVRERLLNEKKIVFVDDQHGKRLAVVPRVTGGDVAPLDAFPLYMFDTGKKKAEVLARPVKKTYSLSHFLRDETVRDKFPFPKDFYDAFARIAVVDPRKAASLIEAEVNAFQDDFDATVVVGKIMRNKTLAREAIAIACRPYAAVTKPIHSTFDMRRVFLYGPEGERGWSVSCKPGEMVTAHAIYRAVLACGVDDVLLLLENELSLLSIEVYRDAVDGTMPRFLGHSGPVQPGEVIETPDVVRERLDKRGNDLLGVVDVSGRRLAGCVRITANRFLVNSHVLDVAEDLFLEDGSMLTPQTAVARDLWVMIGRESEMVPWRMRQAIEGEEVVFVSGGSDLTGPTVLARSRVGRVLERSFRVDNTTDVTAGHSGAAVISVADGSLLGVHAGEMGQDLIAYAITPDELRRVMVDDDAVSNAGVDSEDAVRWTESVVAKGLKSVYQGVLDSMSLYTCGSDVIGTRFRMDGFVYQPVVGTRPVRVRDDVEAVNLDVERYPTEGVGSEGPNVIREPIVGEMVRVLGADRRGTFLSPEVCVTQVKSDGYFLLEKFDTGMYPYRGAVVVSRECAVLGLFCRRTQTRDGGFMLCWNQPRALGSSVVDRATWLFARFPYLTRDAWPDTLLEEVFTSTGSRSEEQKKHAFMGDTIAKLYLVESLKARGGPRSAWSAAIQRLQSNEAMANFARADDWAKVICVDGGSGVACSTRHYADAVEALVGAAHGCEPRDIVLRLCRDLKLLED